jgi:hypothetical protein
MVGKSIAEIIGEEAFRTILPYVERVLEGHRVEYKSEIAYRGLAAASFMSYTPDRKEHGEVAGWMASILDITDQKQAHERERTLLLEIQHRGNNLRHLSKHPIQSARRSTYDGRGQWRRPCPRSPKPCTSSRTNGAASIAANWRLRARTMTPRSSP